MNAEHCQTPEPDGVTIQISVSDDIAKVFYPNIAAEIDRLREQRDRLLEACKAAAESRNHPAAYALDPRMSAALELMRSAIDACQEEQT